MERKKIQEERMKTYFIQAAKEMLKAEGIKSINVRSVSYRAGYSYATLYNYFKDLNDLIFLCVRDFQDECERSILEKIKNISDGKEKIHAITKSYVEYLIEYPGIFELFFLEKMNNAGNKKEISELIYTFLDRICEKHWNVCKEKGIINSAQVEIKKKQLYFLIVGMLVFFENRNQPSNYEEFISLLDSQLDNFFEW
ncbi:MAG: TetR/AcrR family transcriptional regulator [Bacteroidales bacterium]|jgi:AcrR family transcriptional regulator|nr:TetR/AcrR family transcriptional regulator [Bacteroidales bacterium]